jgi:hypothetical protein
MEQTGVAVTIQNRIRGVLGSNLNRNTGYLDRGVSWFSSVPGECLDLCHDRFHKFIIQF